jgi:hypothetical protein
MVSSRMGSLVWEQREEVVEEDGFFDKGEHFFELEDGVANMSKENDLYRNYYIIDTGLSDEEKI